MKNEFFAGTSCIRRRAPSNSLIIIVLLLFLAPAAAWADPPGAFQKSGTQNPMQQFEYRRKLAYTLQSGETLLYDEQAVHLGLNGPSAWIQVERENGIFIILNGKEFGPFSNFPTVWSEAKAYGVAKILTPGNADAEPELEPELLTWWGNTFRYEYRKAEFVGDCSVRLENSGGRVFIAIPEAGKRYGPFDGSYACIDTLVEAERLEDCWFILSRRETGVDPNVPPLLAVNGTGESGPEGIWFSAANTVGVIRAAQVFTAEGYYHFLSDGRQFGPYKPPAGEILSKVFWIMGTDGLYVPAYRTVKEERCDKPYSLCIGGKVYGPYTGIHGLYGSERYWLAYISDHQRNSTALVESSGVKRAGELIGIFRQPDGVPIPLYTQAEDAYSVRLCFGEKRLAGPFSHVASEGKNELQDENRTEVECITASKAYSNADDYLVTSQGDIWGPHDEIRSPRYFRERKTVRFAARDTDRWRLYENGIPVKDLDPDSRDVLLSPNGDFAVCFIGAPDAVYLRTGEGTDKGPYENVCGFQSDYDQKLSDGSRLGPDNTLIFTASRDGSEYICVAGKERIMEYGPFEEIGRTSVIQGNAGSEGIWAAAVRYGDGTTSVLINGRRYGSGAFMLQASPLEPACRLAWLSLEERSVFINWISDRADASSTKSSGEPSPVFPITATCTESRVRVRQAGSLDAPVLGFLEKGDPVTLLSRTALTMKIDADEDYWYLVQRESDGLTGWSFGAFLYFKGKLKSPQ